MNNTKSSLFLIELIITILFFSLAGAVCIQLFVKAHVIDQSTVNKNHAILIAQNLSEGFLGCNGDVTALSSLFSDSNTSTDTSQIILAYDSNWNPVTTGSFSYTATLSYTEDSSYHYADIIVVKTEPENSSPLFHISVKKHIPERGDPRE